MKTPRLSPEEEKSLWNEFRAGGRVAFEKLLQTHYRGLYHYGAKFSKDGEFVKDCIQELFLELWKNRATLGETSYPRSYLLKSLRRKMYRELYRNRRHAQAEPLEEDYHFDVAFSAEHLLLREEAAKDTAEKMAHLLNLLPRRQKEIVYLRYFQELEVSEITQVMDITPQSVYNLLHKAVSRLRQYWFDETEKSLGLVLLMGMLS